LYRLKLFSLVNPLRPDQIEQNLNFRDRLYASDTEYFNSRKEFLNAFGTQELFQIAGVATFLMNVVDWISRREDGRAHQLSSFFSRFSRLIFAIHISR
jgi:hypothetical protein